MHVAAFDGGSLGALPILASGSPVAVGAALSGCLQQAGRVVVSFFGEGALAQGTLHESFNLAAVWQLPVVFVCEDNQYAVSTHASQTIAFRDLPALAGAYGMPAEQVDGQDVLAVMDAAHRLAAHARAGQGPGLLHARTCRFEGHYFGEPQAYRSRDEVQQARLTRDPIPRLRDRLLAQGRLSEAEAQAIQEEARLAVEAALHFAETSPDPDPQEVAAYVYVD
jgi:TPP-dependent pyruvate/acetoin dehydrogenase alpha subunit